MEWQDYNYQFEGLQNHLERIVDKKIQLDKFRPIPDYALRSIKESLTIEWTYNSNSIEGNTMTLQETKLVLEEGITIKGKSLREHFETVNHQDAIEYVESLVSPKYQFTTNDILDVHALVLAKIEKDYAGRFRTSGVRITGANFNPPNALKVSSLVDELVDWANNSEMNSLIKAAIFHHRFVWIHPFFDGNGRTARLLFNIIFMKMGFPPAIILKNDRKKYYDALNNANKQDYSKLLLLVLQALERSLDIYLSSLNNTFDDYMNISEIVKEDSVPYGQEYVSLLARTGKIDAFKEGRNWLTTEKAVVEYMQKRSRVRIFKT
ncbi:Fic family protein [Halpernia frigidisoli]|uniref:Fic family protein n=1 Tax=Halpernia frigidisoli TaxID=1125876 RepID=A0A1I3DDN6_9FLAO|nr:Fic family protein [Halpernia frigidisoli]SFH84709.1 Fic family protein [Halpernia frigidisoli]